MLRSHLPRCSARGACGLTLAVGLLSAPAAALALAAPPAPAPTGVGARPLTGTTSYATPLSSADCAAAPSVTTPRAPGSGRGANVTSLCDSHTGPPSARGGGPADPSTDVPATPPPSSSIERQWQGTTPDLAPAAPITTTHHRTHHATPAGTGTHPSTGVLPPPRGGGPAAPSEHCGGADRSSSGECVAPDLAPSAPQHEWQQNPRARPPEQQNAPGGPTASPLPEAPTGGAPSPNATP